MCSSQGSRSATSRRHRRSTSGSSPGPGTFSRRTRRREIRPVVVNPTGGVPSVVVLVVVLLFVFVDLDSYDFAGLQGLAVHDGGRDAPVRHVDAVIAGGEAVREAQPARDDDISSVATRSDCARSAGSIPASATE